MVRKRDATALEHQQTGLARSAGDLGDEPGLTDARVATDEDDAGSPAGGFGDGLGQGVQFRLPPDEERTRDARRHAFHGT
jgi:hypothetical protein